MKETGKGWGLFPARFTPPRVSFLKLEAVLAEPEACGLGPQGKMRGRGAARAMLASPSTGLSHCMAMVSTVGILL